MYATKCTTTKTLWYNALFLLHLFVCLILCKSKGWRILLETREFGSLLFCFMLVFVECVEWCYMQNKMETQPERNHKEYEEMEKKSRVISSWTKISTFRTIQNSLHFQMNRHALTAPWSQASDRCLLTLRLVHHWEIIMQNHFEHGQKKRYFRLLYYHNSDDKIVYCSANYDHQLAINVNWKIEADTDGHFYVHVLTYTNEMDVWGLQLYTHTPKLKSNNNCSVYNTYIYILSHLHFHLIFGFCGQNLDKPCLFSLTILVNREVQSLTTLQNIERIFKHAR